MSTTDQNDGDETAPWTPQVGEGVVAYPGTDRHISGRIVDDFGDFTAHGVEVNDTTIAAPARRWAVLTADDRLVFVDTDHLTPAAAQPIASPDTAEHGDRS
ncbi:hypothetical protein [Williamsia maris]|uniref:DUF1918 domain-containing protein n=1 Tax=Williamsia maris TaxID=72806 RepID=A0ABT1HJB4_9NOCA|nr:hypothetical protein [Williamsia maris]MCP2178016.1 hypothetical protein [Williamsia maris]